MWMLEISIAKDRRKIKKNHRFQVKQNENFSGDIVHLWLCSINGVFLCVSLCVKQKNLLFEFFSSSHFSLTANSMVEKKRNNGIKHLFYVYSFFFVSWISVRQTTHIDCVPNGLCMDISFYWSSSLLFFPFEFCVFCYCYCNDILFIICCWCVCFVLFCSVFFFCSSAQDFFHVSFFYACLAFFNVECQEKKGFCRYCPWIMVLKCESHLAIFRMIFLSFLWVASVAAFVLAVFCGCAVPFLYVQIIWDFFQIENDNIDILRKKFAKISNLLNFEVRNKFANLSMLSKDQRFQNDEPDLTEICADYNSITALKRFKLDFGVKKMVQKSWSQSVIFPPVKKHRRLEESE